MVNGEFAIYIYDRAKNKHLLFRDRWGVNNVYYKVKNGVLYFASEMKCLVSSDTQISQNDLIEHFVFQFGISPHTIFDEIFTLRPGTYLQFSDNTGIQIYDFEKYIYIENDTMI
jgi:asparagine synthase (glutamine-hydrolysing)